MTKKLLDVKVDTIHVYRTNIVDFKSEIEKLISGWGTNASVHLEQELYSNSWELNVYAKIPETDEEYKKRLAQEKAEQARKDAHDRKEFERLQKKFGAADDN